MKKMYKIWAKRKSSLQIYLQEMGYLQTPEAGCLYKREKVHLKEFYLNYLEVIKRLDIKTPLSLRDFKYNLFLLGVNAENVSIKGKTRKGYIFYKECDGVKSVSIEGEEWYSIEVISSALKFSNHHIYYLVSKGEIKSIKYHGKSYFKQI